jgi:ferredoxin
MKVTIDQDRCIGSGQCVLAAAEVFDQRDDDGIVVLLTDDPSPDLHEAVRHAAGFCPALAITLTDS